jgi:hypothetical protein
VRLNGAILLLVALNGAILLLVALNGAILLLVALKLRCYGNTAGRITERCYYFLAVILNGMNGATTERYCHY